MSQDDAELNTFKPKVAQQLGSQLVILDTSYYQIDVHCIQSF